MAQSQEQHPPVSPEAIQLGYEPEAVSLRGIIIFLVILIVTAVVLHVGLWFLMVGLSRHNASELDAPISAVAAPVLPQGPLLQPSVGHDTTPELDLQALRQDEDEVFARLGWKVNRSTHNVEIPPEVVRQVAEQARARAAAAPIPPTTTGKPTNSILPPGATSQTRPSNQGAAQP